MRSATLFAAGSWAIALLVGSFIWLSPDAGIYPAPGVAAAVVGAALLLWLVGGALTAFPRSASRLSFGALAGGVGPVAAAALALLLAGHGLLPHPALPMVFILLAGIGGHWWIRRSPEAPATGTQRIGLVLLLLPTTLILGPALLLAIRGQGLWPIAVPDYAPIIERYNSINALTPLRPRAVPSISADAAGRALVGIANTGHAERAVGLIDVPGSSPRPWLPEGGPFHGWSGDSVMQHALRGLTRAERTWLVGAAGHPGSRLFDTVAYAERLDPWAALKSPVADEIDALSLPAPNILNLRAAARLQLYRAALAVADHHPALADSITRGVIGFGLRLRDDADQLPEALIGVSIVREAVLTLADIWGASGRRAQGDALRQQLLAGPARTSPPDTVMVLKPPMRIRAEMIGSLLAHASPRPVEWDLAGLLSMTRCTDLRELIYGPTRRADSALDAFESRLRNSAQSQDAFAVLRRGFRFSGRVRGGIVVPFAALAVGRPELTDCLNLGSLAN